MVGFDDFLKPSNLPFIAVGFIAGAVLVLGAQAIVKPVSSVGLDVETNLAKW